MPPPATRTVASRDEVAAFFDSIAGDYRDVHDRAERALADRLRIIRAAFPPLPPDRTRHAVLLEIGCGTGLHLLPLAGEFDRAIGTDLSSEMVAATRAAAASPPWAERLERSGIRVEARVDPAEELETVADSSVDVVVCVGALEHMWDRPRVLAQVRRVLAPGGRFVCLTPNGGWIWYRRLADRFGHAIRHLSTDRFLTAADLAALAGGAGLEPISCAPWGFLPRGDLPVVWRPILAALDQVGRWTGVSALRGGLAFVAERARTSS